MFHELLSRDREDGCATGQPQGVGPEAYLNSTSQGPTPEDARKGTHIRGRSKQFMKHAGLPASRCAGSLYLHCFGDRNSCSSGALAPPGPLPDDFQSDRGELTFHIIIYPSNFPFSFSELSKKSSLFY